MKQKTVTNNLKITLVILTIAALLSFLAISYSISKYTASQAKDYTVTSHDFYFSSDKLTAEGAVEEITAADTNYQFYLYNFVGSDTASYDISYTINISDIITLGDDTITVEDYGAGQIGADTSTSVPVTITFHEDVYSFKITVSTTNGYGKSLSVTINSGGE